MAKQVKFWSGLEASLSWFSTQWQWLASVTGVVLCAMWGWEGPGFPGSLLFIPHACPAPTKLCHELLLALC